MAWVVVALTVVGILTVAALALVKQPRDAQADLDPLFLVGIPVAGVGAALFATMGPPALGLAGIGVALLVIGAVRSHNRAE